MTDFLAVLASLALLVGGGPDLDPDLDYEILPASDTWCYGAMDVHFSWVICPLGEA